MTRAQQMGRNGIVQAYDHEETTYKYDFPHGKSERRFRGYSPADLNSPASKGSNAWGRPVLKQRPQVHKTLPYCSSMTRVAPYDPNPRQINYQIAPHGRATDIVRTNIVLPDRSGPLLPNRVDQSTYPVLQQSGPNPLPSVRQSLFPEYQHSVNICERPVPPNLQHNSPANIELWTLQNAANGMQESQEIRSKLSIGPVGPRAISDDAPPQQDPKLVFQFADFNGEPGQPSSVANRDIELNSVQQHPGGETISECLTRC